MVPSYTHHPGLIGHRRDENNPLSEDVWQSVGPGPSRDGKGMILRHYMSFTQASPGNLYSVGTDLGSWLFRDVISGGRCILVLQDIYMLISVPGYNADYFLLSYQRLCLHFCFYFEKSLHHQDRMNVLPVLKLNP